MTCGGEGESGNEMLMDCLLKCTCKLTVLVEQNGFGQSMELKDVREEESRKGGSVNIGGGGEEVTHFLEAVHNGEDGVMVIASHRESSDEVHGDVFPLLGGDGE